MTAQSLIQKRNDTLDLLKRLGSQMDSDTVLSWNAAMLEIQQQKVQKLWNVFQDCVINLSSMSGLSAKTLSKNDKKAMAASKIYTQLKDRLEQLTQETDTTRFLPAPKISEIILEKFDGNYTKWTAWRSNLQSKVLNTKLPAGTKIDVLLSALEGDARKCAGDPERRDQMELDRIWSTLEDAYDNPYQIVISHINNILDLPDLRQPGAKQFQHMINVCDQELRSLTRFGYDVESWSPILAVVMLRKLDHSTRSRWEMDREPNKAPALVEVTDYLKRRIHALHNASVFKEKELVSQPFVKRAAPQSVDDPPPKRPFFMPDLASGSNATGQNRNPINRKSSKISCLHCKGHHPIFRCEKFLELTLDQRKDRVRQLNLCYGCLSSEHLASACTWVKCRNCNDARHHRSLCPKSTIMRSFHARRGNSTSRARESHVFNVTADKESEGLQVIGTLLFKLQQPCNSSTGNIRALCDPGSQLNLITEDCIQRWKLEKIPFRRPIFGVGSSAPLISSGFIDVVMVDRKCSSPTVPIRFTVVSKISDHNPQRHFKSPIDNQLSTSELGDPTFNRPGKIDALIGVGVWADIIGDKLIKFEHGDCRFVAQKTLLGWVIAGHTCQSEAVKSLIFQISASDIDLDAKLERLFEIDVDNDSRKLTFEEQKAEEIFVNTHSRDEFGRYIVTVPLRDGVTPLGRSRHVALNRFMALEKRLSKAGNERMSQEFKDFMKDYIDAGHLVLASPAPENPSLSYYVPYHIIDRKKFRVVFDASCVTSSGVSFNDLQLPGPKLQPDLNQTILLFRTYRYALTADIIKMYRQVKVHPDQHNYQRILYRASPTDPIQEHVITRVIWGFTSAGFNAVRALQQCAADAGAGYPEAAVAVMNNFYMDDLLWGADTFEDLSTRQQQITELLKRGGFELSKWATNNSDMASRLQTNDSELVLQDEMGVLGMVWDTKMDTFRLKVKRELNHISCSLTKREVISQISQVYDPTGFFLPVVVTGKMLIQAIWKLNLSWDENVPEIIIKQLAEFKESVLELADISVPRWIAVTKYSQLELNLFSDASERACGTCAYIRSTENGQTTVRLITSRCRVAPIKNQTIPRLELVAAVMSVELSKYILKACNFVDIPVHFWTDSMIVLHWLRKDAGTLKHFVSNRVSVILQDSRFDQWHHIPGVQNPADLLSRGCCAEVIKNSRLWWSGPEWLGLPSYKCPIEPAALTYLESVDVVQKESKEICLLAQVSKHDTLPISIKTDKGYEALDIRTSTLNKLLRTTAFVFRFIRNCRRRYTNQNKCVRKFKEVTALTPHERDEAFRYWIKQSQLRTFAAEGEALRRKCELSSDSKLLQLYPYIDAQGIIRVGGRLGNSALPDETRHQAILHHLSALAVLVIKDAHQKVMHGGTQLTISQVRQKIWILRLRREAKKVINNCVICIRFKKEHAEQLMGSLPSIRSRQAFPFLHSGVDFAGPFEVRKTAAPKMPLRSSTKSTANSSKATIKCWVVVFVCLVTRAVHIDLAHGLSSEAFLEVFSRFVSRRGQCKELWSDNGTNFVGANKEIQRVKREWANKLPNEELANHGTTWRFITPGAPHQGGLWEASIKSMKHHLKKAMGCRVLSTNQLYTVLTQIEGCLNSRPLLPINDDPTDLECLTPAHFLIGRPISFMPLSENIIECNDNRLTLWGQQQKIYQSFWCHWRNDYLVSLQKRTKWQRAKTNIQAGDMVIIMSDNLPPAFWPLARVKLVHPGPDRLVRNATLITSTGEKIRPVQKLCMLPRPDSQPGAVGMTT